MNNTDMLLVQETLNTLVGCTLSEMNRTNEMLLLTFAEPAGLGQESREHVLRLQCYYRFVQDGRMVFAHSDYFQPSEKMWQLWQAQGYEEDFIPENYCCDDEGANRLDDRIAEMNALLLASAYRVCTVMVDSIGDVTMCFDNGAVLSVLVDTSGGEECWRHFPPEENKPQLVIYSDGVEYEEDNEP